MAFLITKYKTKSPDGLETRVPSSIRHLFWILKSLIKSTLLVSNEFDLTKFKGLTKVHQKN